MGDGYIPGYSEEDLIAVRRLLDSDSFGQFEPSAVLDHVKKSNDYTTAGIYVGTAILNEYHNPDCDPEWKEILEEIALGKEVSNDRKWIVGNWIAELDLVRDGVERVNNYAKSGSTQRELP